jgi:Ca2+-binding EF-hand superfamily protein
MYDINNDGRIDTGEMAKIIRVSVDVAPSAIASVNWQRELPVCS